MYTDRVVSAGARVLSAPFTHSSAVRRSEGTTADFLAEIRSGGAATCLTWLLRSPLCALDRAARIVASEVDEHNIAMRRCNDCFFAATTPDEREHDTLITAVNLSI